MLAIPESLVSRQTLRTRANLCGPALEEISFVLDADKACGMRKPSCAIDKGEESISEKRVYKRH